MGDVAISVTDLGKRYRINAGERASYQALRDTLAGAVTAPFRAVAAVCDGRRPRLAGNRRHHDIWALQHLSLDIRAGEVVGIIGRNGAGKSTLLKILSRITYPTEGWARIRGRVGSLLEVGTGFHPELTGRENIYLNGAILGMSRADIRRRFDEVVDFAEIETFIDTPVKRYSSGMYMRLAFAVAAHLEPDILLVDEVLAVGDFQFQKKCLGKMEEVHRQGRTVLLVSHNMASILNLCSRAILLDGGHVVRDASAEAVVQHYVATAPQTGSEVAWPDPNDAPGNDHVRIRSVRLLTDTGTVSSEHDIEKDIQVEMQWWNLVDGARYYSALNLRDPYGTVLLGTNSMPSACVQPDRLWNQPHPAGLYIAVCRIPGNLLNEGTYTIDAIVGTNISHTQVCLDKVLSFRVYDSGAMRKEYNGPWHGLIRVRMQWSTRHLSTAVS